MCDLASFGLQKLKSLRHPCLVRWLASGRSAEGLYLVTEQVRPLAMALPWLSAMEVAAGLYHVLEALVFLHHTVSIRGTPPLATVQTDARQLSVMQLPTM